MGHAWDVNPSAQHPIHLLLGLLSFILLFFPKNSTPAKLSTHSLFQMHQLLQSHIPSQGQQVHQQESGEHGGLLWRGEERQGGKDTDESHRTCVQFPLIVSLLTDHTN